MSRVFHDLLGREVDDEDRSQYRDRLLREGWDEARLRDEVGLQLRRKVRGVPGKRESCTHHTLTPPSTLTVIDHPSWAPCATPAVPRVQHKQDLAERLDSLPDMLGSERVSMVAESEVLLELQPKSAAPKALARKQVKWKACATVAAVTAD